MRELIKNKSPKAIIGCHSGVGSIVFKRPIIDFDLRDCKSKRIQKRFLYCIKIITIKNNS